MIFTKQIRLVFLLPVLISTCVIIIVTFARWSQSSFEWIQKLGDYLSESKRHTFEIYSYGIRVLTKSVNSYSAQVEYQNLAIQEQALAHLFYKLKLGAVQVNSQYHDVRFNAISDQELSDYNSFINSTNDSQYTSSWYNSNTTNLNNTGQQANIDVFGFSSFLHRAIMESNYTLLKKKLFSTTLNSDGTSAFYPAQFLPLSPTENMIVSKQYDASYNNCSYNSTPRNFYYELRCNFQFLNTVAVDNTDLIFNKPYVQLNHVGTPSIQQSVCTNVKDVNNQGNYGDLCLQYDTVRLRRQLKQSQQMYITGGTVRTYVMNSGSRYPLIYTAELVNVFGQMYSKLTKIEDLEFNDTMDAFFLEEKEDFIKKSNFFQAVYNISGQECGGFESLAQYIPISITKMQEDFYLVSRNLSICVLLIDQQDLQQNGYAKMNKSQYVEQIIGTIVTEVSLLEEQAKIYDITNNLSLSIQLTISIAAIITIIIVAGLNWYSQKLAEQIAEPIDYLIHALRTVDEGNIENYFIEMLQGDLKQHTPEDLGQLIRAVYDFVGIVKIANEAFIQGNDSQALIGYAVANQFYIENGNKLGAGVIQNNMGTIHMRNKRFSESVHSFKKAIEVIQCEWDRYKKKYLQFGVTEKDLHIDSEFQTLSSTVLNRCFNLCECLSQYLMTETSPLEKHLFTTLEDTKVEHKHQINNLPRKPTQQRNQVDYAPLESDRDIEMTDHSDMSHPDSEKLLILESRPEMTDIIRDLLQMNDSLESIRLKLLQNKKSKIKLRHSQIENEMALDAHQVDLLIKQLWKDTILTYSYCKKLMESQLQYSEQQQKRLYICLKIILGHLHLGQIAECDFDQAQDILDELKYRQANHQLQDDNFQYSVSILEQKMHLYRGIICHKMGQQGKAAEYITKSLSVVGTYSPRDRVEGLLILKSIFAGQQLEQDYSSIDELLRKYQIIVKDVVFLLDYGASMSRNRNIIKAMYVINNLFELTTGPNDRIGYYLLNNECREILPLTSKVKNEIFIREMLQFVPQPTCIKCYRLCTEHVSSIDNGLEVVFKKLNKSAHPNLVMQDNKFYIHKNDNSMTPYKRFLVLLSDQLNIVEYADHLEIVLDGLFLQKLNETKTNLVVVTFRDSVKQFKNLPSNVCLFSESQSHLLSEYFEEFEQKIELPGSNFYYEQTI